MLNQHCQPHAGDAGAHEPQRRKSRRLIGKATGNFHRYKRDSALNNRKTDQVGVNRRGSAPYIDSPSA